MDGNLKWKKDFGVLRSVFFRVKSAEWEFASSPIIYKGKVIIQCDVMENSFLATYDVKSGKELWKKERDEYPGWCTPNIYAHGDKIRIAVNGFKHRGGYDFETGEEIWKMSGGGDIQIPTPIVGKDLIYFNSAHGSSSPIYAVNTNAEGEITLEEGQTSNSKIKWSMPRGGSYMQTLLLYDGYLYNLGWNGRIECYNPQSGEVIYKEKLGKSKSFVASPVASDGLIYTVSEDGEVYVIKSGKNFEVVYRNKLKEICMVTPAITEGIIYFRTQKGLIAVGKS
jgi:outer membrane protein assembly factor BamB